MDSRPGSEVAAGGTDRFEHLAPALAVRVRRALVAAYGIEVGREATADAIAYAWEHWEKVQIDGNPAGQLYRVGQSAARKYRPRRPIALPMPPPGDEWADVRPELPAALARLLVGNAPQCCSSTRTGRRLRRRGGDAGNVGVDAAQSPESRHGSPAGAPRGGRRCRRLRISSDATATCSTTPRSAPANPSILRSRPVRRTAVRTALVAVAVVVVVSLIAVVSSTALDARARTATAPIGPNTTNPGTTTSSTTTPTPSDAQAKAWITEHGGRAVDLHHSGDIAMSDRAVYTLSVTDAATSIPVMLSRVDRQTLRVVSVPAKNAVDVYVGGGAVYLVTNHRADSSVQRLDPDSLQPLWTFPLVDPNASYSPQSRGTLRRCG